MWTTLSPFTRSGWWCHRNRRITRRGASGLRRIIWIKRQSSCGGVSDEHAQFCNRVQTPSDDCSPSEMLRPDHYRCSQMRMTDRNRTPQQPFGLQPPQRPPSSRNCRSSRRGRRCDLKRRGIRKRPGARLPTNCQRTDALTYSVRLFSSLSNSALWS